MTVQDVLSYVIELQEPAFSEEYLLRWLNQVEAEVQVEILLMAAEGITQYTKENKNAVLIAPPPFDKLYEDYLIWRIAVEQGEAERANNLQVIYNESYLAYVRFVCETIDPKSGNAEILRYYLTAYQIAVKLGYTGTEEEWIESLKGPKGDPGPIGPEGPIGPAGPSFDIEYDEETGMISFLRGENDENDESGATSDRLEVTVTYASSGSTSSHSFTEIKSAIEAGKEVVVFVKGVSGVSQYTPFKLSQYNSVSIYFYTFNGEGTRFYYVQFFGSIINIRSAVMLNENTITDVYTVSSSNTVPSSKALNDVYKMVQNIDPDGSIAAAGGIAAWIAANYENAEEGSY